VNEVVVRIVRPTFLSAICILIFLCVACPFSKSPAPRPIGPAVKADILIYFKRDISSEESNLFIKNVLSRPHPEGRGDYNAPGIQTLLAIRAVEGHEGIAVTFFPNATDEQRQELMRAIKESRLVYKVLENVAPDNIKTLN
jgi:hypothetical protein